MVLCKVMQVSRSGYYHFINPVKKSEILNLIVKVKALAKLSLYSYGGRQISKNLKAQGYPVGRYRA